MRNSEDRDRAGGSTTDAMVSNGLLARPPQRDPIASKLDEARVQRRFAGTGLHTVRIGRFILLELIGQGGMGQVFSAYDDELDRKVAIKVVHDGSEAAEANERMLREAQTLARLSHPNVVQVYDVGSFQGRMYIAMEFIRGINLRHWLEKKPRDGKQMRWREVLRLFIAVGRGLEAAHQAKLAHRDFKPANVLIGTDGRPRVVDFGLARRLAQPADKPANPDPDRDDAEPQSRTSAGHVSTRCSGSSDGPNRPARGDVSALTTQGRIMGTIPYMSPEQMRGELADDRSDQFSFCVALYEALYGKRPFAEDLDQRVKQIANGPVLSDPGGVPLSLRKALKRGLSADPDHRFETMGNLLGVLRASLVQLGRRLVMAFAAVLVTTAALSYALMDSADPCIESASSIDSLWHAERKQQLRAAFAASGARFAESTWRTVASQIDGYVASWRTARVATCRGSRIDGSTALSDRREACLDRVHSRLRGALEALETLDHNAVATATDAIHRLPDVTRCDDTAVVLYGVDPPPHNLAGHVAELRAHLQQAETDAVSGQYQRAAARAGELVGQAQQAGYRPVEAEAMAALGLALIHADQPQAVERGEQLLQRASHLAEAERHDTLIATVWNDLVLSAYRHHRTTERGRAWAERAFAAVERIGSPAALAVTARRYLALLEVRDGQLDKAEPMQREAVAMSRGTPAQVRATALQELGTTLRDQRRYEEAQHCYDQAMALLAAAVDESHPAVLAVQLDIGLLAFRSGKLDRAEQVLDHVSASLCDVFGTGHRRCGHAHLQLAEVLRSQGRLDQASEHVMHGLAAYQRAYESDHPALAEVHIRLGALLYRRGEYQRALDEYRAAYALEVANKSADHVDAAYAQATVAEALWALGRFDEARAATEQIETALRAGDQWNDPLRAFVLSIRGRSNVELGNDGDAIAMLQAAAQGLDNNADLAIELADVYWAMARALAAGPGPDQSRARDFEQRACQIYREQSREVHIPAEVIGACAQRRADDRE